MGFWRGGGGHACFSAILAQHGEKSEGLTQGLGGVWRPSQSTDPGSWENFPKPRHLNFVLAFFSLFELHVSLKILISQPLNKSRMKQKAEAQPKDKVILFENRKIDCNNNKPANYLKRSWVWNHFELAKDDTKATCQVVVLCKGSITVFGEKMNPETVKQLLCLKEWYQSKDLSCLN